MNTDLTPLQAQLLEFLITYSETRGRMPTQRRMADEFRLDWLTTLHNRLKALEKKGWIRRTGKPGGIVITRWP